MTTELKKTPLMIAAALVMALGISACNTVKGAGEDIESAGDAISDTANDVQNDMETK